MLIIGLLLMAGAAAFTGLLIAFNLSGGPDYTVTLLGSQPFTISVLGAFLGGLALALIFGFGLWLMLGGAALLAHRSKKRRATRHEARDAVAERDEMKGQRDEVRSRAAEVPSGARSTRSATHGRRSHRLHLPRH